MAGCVERTAGHALVWIDTSFACGCSCTRSVRSTQSAASHHSPRVSNCLTVPAPRHSEAAQYRAFKVAWASNDAPSKDLSNTRALKHLAPLETDYWAASHSFIEPPRFERRVRLLKICQEVDGLHGLLEKAFFSFFSRRPLAP